MLFNLISVNKQLTLVRILALAFAAFFGFVVVCLTVFFKMRYFNSALAIDKGSPKQKDNRTCRMAQQVEELAAKPSNLCLVPSTHKVEGENRLLKLSHDLHLCHDTNMHAHTNE